MEITRETAKEWRLKLNAVLEPLAKEMGCVVKIGGITYSPPNEMHTKITFNVFNPAKQKDPADEYRKNLPLYNKLFEVTEDDLGVMAKDGCVFVGVAPNRPKYAYVFKRPDGQLTFGTKGYFVTAKRRGISK